MTTSERPVSSGGEHAEGEREAAGFDPGARGRHERQVDRHHSLEAESGRAPAAEAERQHEHVGQSGRDRGRQGSGAGLQRHLQRPALAGRQAQRLDVAQRLEASAGVDRIGERKGGGKAGPKRGELAKQPGGGDEGGLQGDDAERRAGGEAKYPGQG